MTLAVEVEKNQEAQRRGDAKAQSLFLTAAPRPGVSALTFVIL